MTLHTASYKCRTDSEARLYSKRQLEYLQRDFHAHMIVLEVQVEYVKAKTH